MFLSFLTKSQLNDDVIVVCYGGTVAEFYTMDFPAGSPSPLDGPHEVRCGIAFPDIGGKWAFHMLGGGTMKSGDDRDTALSYFVEIKQQIDGVDAKVRADAIAHFDQYMIDVLNQFFSPEDIETIAATYMPADIAKAMIESKQTVSH